MPDDELHIFDLRLTDHLIRVLHLFPCFFQVFDCIDVSLTSEKPQFSLQTLCKFYFLLKDHHLTLTASPLPRFKLVAFVLAQVQAASNISNHKGGICGPINTNRG